MAARGGDVRAGVVDPVFGRREMDGMIVGSEFAGLAPETELPRILCLPKSIPDRRRTGEEQLSE